MDKSYKIVQTTENGGMFLAAVPSSWESGRLLSWPPKKIESMAFRNNMQPDSTWKSFQCTLKRQNMSSQQAATEEIQKMSRNSDTDTENVKRVQKSVFNNGDAARIDHNAQFGPQTANDVVPIIQHSSPLPQQIMLQPSQQTLGQPLQQQQPNQFIYSSIDPNAAALQQQSHQFVYTSTNTNDMQATSFVLENDSTTKRFNDDSTYITEEESTEVIDIQTLMGTLASIVESQSKLEVKFTEQIKMVNENLAEQMKIMNDNFAHLFKLLSEAKPSQQETSQVNIDEPSFELIDSVEGLEALEEKLKESAYVNSLVS